MPVSRPNAHWPAKRVFVALASVVLAVLTGVVALATSRSADSCSLGGQPTSVYEWREAAWRSDAARLDLLDTAESLCIETVHVDLTGAAVVEAEELDAMLADLVALASEANERAIRIAGLAGDPWWPTSEGLEDATVIVDAVLDANRRLPSDAQIAELHIDAEPWGLPEWTSTKSHWSREYVSFVDALVEYRDAQAAGLRLAFLIPYWFDGSNGEAPTIEMGSTAASPFDHLVAADHQAVSYVVMAYRDQAEGAGGILSLLDDELSRDVSIALAVETAAVEPSTITFADDGLGVLDTQLRIVHDALGGDQLVGVVINDMESLTLLTGYVDE